MSVCEITRSLSFRRTAQAAAECDGQTVQLQGVIQAPQTSVIQSPHLQTVQVSARDGLAAVFCTSPLKPGGNWPGRKHLECRRHEFK